MGPYFDKAKERERKSPYHQYRIYRSLYSGVFLLTILIWGSAFLVTAVSSLLQRSPSDTYWARTPKNGETRVFPWYQAASTNRKITMADVREDVFRPEYKELQWIQSPESISNDQGTYLLKHAVKDKTTYAVKSIIDEGFHYTLFNDSSFTYHGVRYDVDSLKASPDLSKAILRTDTTKGWRHSSTARFWVLDVSSGDIAPLLNQHDKLSVASWAPTSDAIAFVYKNDVYVKHLDRHIISRVTSDGSANIFNGKPDWVYEEEVFASDIVLWWSPRGDKLAFLKFNDTQVPEFPIPYYVQSGHDEYPELKSIKYPKPGFSNPSVDVVVAQLPKVSGGAFDVHKARLSSKTIHDYLVTEVVWVSDDFVLIKTTNRASDIMEVFLVSADAGAEASLIRTHHAENSWFEVTNNALFVPRNDSLGRYADGYIDLVSVNGYNHLAYFTPPNNPKPFMLTEGRWEVLSNHVDLSNNQVYFTATKNSSVERHIYSVNLLDVFHQYDSPNVKRVSGGIGWYSSSYSSGVRFLLLTYQGPDVPHQTLLDLHTGQVVKTIEKNIRLQNSLKNYDIPEQTVTTVDLGVDAVSGGKVLANAMEILPPGFNSSLQYPVLFYVYGGPGSQLVSQEYAIGFSHVVASQLNAVVVTVDGRGTGYNNHDEKLGANFKFCVRDRLGHYEPLDQIAAARVWAQKPYVDKSRIGIWGWSYGGFLTLKTLETDVDHVFSFGVAVAPVTKWKLYDSIYTERYLRTPQENPEGYRTASISNPEAFKGVQRFLIMHGSGDDNVHFQNSLSLLDDYNLASVENFDFMVFPDSDHSIRYHNGNTVVFDRILDWVRRAFNDEFRQHHQPRR